MNNPEAIIYQIRNKINQRKRVTAFNEINDTPNLIQDNTVFRKQRTYQTYSQTSVPEMTKYDIISIRSIARPIHAKDTLLDVVNLAKAHQISDAFTKGFKIDKYFYSHQLWGKKFHKQAMIKTGLRDVGLTIRNQINKTETYNARRNFSSFLVKHKHIQASEEKIQLNESKDNASISTRYKESSYNAPSFRYKKLDPLASKKDFIKLEKIQDESKLLSDSNKEVLSELKKLKQITDPPKNTDIKKLLKKVQIIMKTRHSEVKRRKPYFTEVDSD